MFVYINREWKRKISYCNDCGGLFVNIRALSDRLDYNKYCKIIRLENKLKESEIENKYLLYFDTKK